MSPIRYSLPMLLLLTACLLFAEHRLPTEVHGGFQDSETLIGQYKGQLSRELAYLVLGLVGAVGISSALRSRRSPLLWNRRFVWPLSILIVWSTLSICWSDIPAVSAKRLLVFGLMFLGAFGLTLCWTLAELVTFIAVSATLDLAAGIVGEFIYGYFSPFDSSYRFGGTLTWNEQGYLCMFLCLSSLCLTQTKRSSRWIYGTLSVCGFLFVVLTHSRSALVGLAASLFLYFLLMMKMTGKILAMSLISAIILMMMISGAAPRLVDNLNRRGEGSENLTGRVPLWEELLAYTDRRPWTGYGYEAFWTDKTINDISDDQHWAVGAAHSGYMESLLTLGLVGLSLHTIVLLVGFMEGIRGFRRTGEAAYFLVACGCIVYLLGGVLESVVIVKPSPISFYLAMLLCVIAVRQDSDLSRFPARVFGRIDPAVRLVASD